MKKILLLAIVTISMISCSKSDSSESSTDKIVGKWVVTSSTIQNGANGTPINSMEPCETLGNTMFSQLQQLQQELQVILITKRAQ